jgi:hypothetical protein
MVGYCKHDNEIFSSMKGRDIFKAVERLLTFQGLLHHVSYWM